MSRILNEDELNDIIDKCYSNDIYDLIVENQNLSEEFIEKHFDIFNKDAISSCQKLSENFIEKHKETLNWIFLCHYQKLSEEFIQNHPNLVDYEEVANYQKLSEGFIERHFDDLRCYYNISRYQKLSNEFIEKHSDVLDLNFIKDNWIYKSAEEKKLAVVKTGLYECYDDYFIAYKGIRNDRYSIFNFQYKYEKGETYECWCDCSDSENSFGLSVGTKKHAENYINNNGSALDYVVRCKVKYEDVGRIVHKGEKIRCFKIEIID